MAQIVLRLPDEMLARVEEAYEASVMKSRNAWLVNAIEGALGVAAPFQEIAEEVSPHRHRRGDVVRQEKRGRGVINIYACAECGKELS